MENLIVLEKGRRYILLLHGLCSDGIWCPDIKKTIDLGTHDCIIKDNLKITCTIWLANDCNDFSTSENMNSTRHVLLKQETQLCNWISSLKYQLLLIFPVMWIWYPPSDLITKCSKFIEIFTVNLVCPNIHTQLQGANDWENCIEWMKWGLSE